MSDLLIHVLAGAIGGGLAAIAAATLGKRMVRPDASPNWRKLAPVLVAAPVFVIAFVAVQMLGRGLVGDSSPPDLISSRDTPSEAQLLDSTLNRYRFVRVLQTHHPETRQKLEAIIKDAVQKKDPGVMEARMAELVQQYFPRHIPRTSDAAILRFTNAFIEVFAKLEKTDPESCKRLAIGGGVRGSLNINDMMAPMDAMADVIEDSVTKPQAAPDVARATPLVQEVFAKLYAGNDPMLLPVQMLANMPAAPADKLCYTMLRFYRAVIALPPTDASLVLRQIMGGTP